MVVRRAIAQGDWDGETTRQARLRCARAHAQRTPRHGLTAFARPKDGMALSGYSRRKLRENSFSDAPPPSDIPHLATGLAGTPWTTVIGATALLTTLPAV